MKLVARHPNNWHRNLIFVTTNNQLRDFFGLNENHKSVCDFQLEGQDGNEGRIKLLAELILLCCFVQRLFLGTLACCWRWSGIARPPHQPPEHLPQDILVGIAACGLQFNPNRLAQVDIGEEMVN